MVAKTKVAGGEMLDAALRLVAQGRPVLPLHSAEAGQCTCGNPACSSPGKHPRVPHGILDASGDEAQIRAWWERWPDANIGVPTGAASGSVVVDIDGPEGEAALIALNLNLPATLEVATGRGRHLYFTVPNGAPSKTFGPHLSMRGDGFYVVAPPSLHNSGKRYRWANGLMPIAPAPPELLALLNSAATLVTDSAASLASADGRISDGFRKRTLLRMAMGMALEGHTPPNVEAVLQDLNKGRCDPPLPRRDLQRVVRKAFEYVARQRQKKYGRGAALPVDATAETSVCAENSTTLANEIRQIVVGGEKPAFDKKREITELVKDALLSRGQFFRTRDSRGFFFHNFERRLYDVEQAPFQRLITSASGLSSTETFFKFAIDLIQTTALRDSKLAEVHTLSHFEPTSGILAVSDGGPGIWIREMGGEWQQIRNGENGLFFLTDDDCTTWVPEFSDDAPQRWWLDQFLFSHRTFSAEESKTLLHVWVSQQFFPPLRRTRVVPCFLGAQGSGKTTAMRLIGRLLAGKEFDVTGVRRDKEDAFVAAVANRAVLALDNADSAIPWLADALATYATGQRYRLRKLYTTNEEATYSPRAILLISSRDPRFNRPDVTERLLPMQFERPEQYQTEEEIFGELERRRGQIMGSLLLHLGRIADDLPLFPPEPLPFRMADFASFGERIFRARGKSAEFVSLLRALEKNQAELASEFDGTVEAIRRLLEQGDAIEAVSTPDLFQRCSKVAQEHNLLIARTAQGFGRHLSSMRRVLEVELGVRMVEMRGHAGKRLVSLVPIRQPALAGVTNEPS